MGRRPYRDEAKDLAAATTWRLQNMSWGEIAARLGRDKNNTRRAVVREAIRRKIALPGEKP